MPAKAKPTRTLTITTSYKERSRGFFINGKPSNQPDGHVATIKSHAPSIDIAHAINSLIGNIPKNGAPTKLVAVCHPKVNTEDVMKRIHGNH